MSNWAAIVYGRTYEVDFRFIATPNDFTEKEKIWAEQYIRVTTRSPEKLRSGYPRWSVFKNEEVSIVGVTCMASALSNKMTQDSKSRVLYLFVGFVSRTPNSELPAMEIELFKPLYDEYVSQKWNEKQYDESRHNPIHTQYKYFLPSFRKAVNIDDEYFSLNQTELDIVRFWPDNEDNRESLWLAASKAISVSLCLGLGSKKDAILKNSPFLNIATADILQKDNLSKISPPNTGTSTGNENRTSLVKPTIIQQESSYQTTNNRQNIQTTSRQEKNENKPKVKSLPILLGLLFSALIGEKFNFPGLLICIAIVFAIGFWLNNSDKQAHKGRDVAKICKYQAKQNSPLLSRPNGLKKKPLLPKPNSDFPRKSSNYYKNTY